MYCADEVNGVLLIFFFQAEVGIRVRDVTGVQTCALPICSFAGGTLRLAIPAIVLGFALGIVVGLARRSEERRVGKEGGSRRAADKHGESFGLGAAGEQHLQLVLFARIVHLGIAAAFVLLG